MPYYVFANFMAYFEEIVKEENKGSGDSESGQSDVMQNAQQSMSGIMNQSKNMMKGFSTPKIPKF